MYNSCLIYLIHSPKSEILLLIVDVYFILRTFFAKNILNQLGTTTAILCDELDGIIATYRQAPTEHCLLLSTC